MPNLEDIEQALRLAPTMPGAYSHLGLICEAMGDKGAAQHAYEKAEELRRR